MRESLIDGLRALAGGIRGNSGGFVRAGAGGDASLYPATGAALATMMGFANAPTSMWLGNAASSPLVDTESPGNDLAEYGTPTYSVNDALLGANTFECDLGINEGAEASANTILDVGDESFALLWVGNIYSNSSTRGLIGKRNDGGTYPGYDINVLAAGTIRGWLDNGGTSQSQTNTGDHTGSASVILMVRDKNANNFRVHSNQSSSAGAAITATGTLTNTRKFRIGQMYTGLASTGQRVALAAMWQGAIAEGLGAAHVSSLASALGF